MVQLLQKKLKSPRRPIKCDSIKYYFSMSSKVVKALKNNGFKKLSAIDAGSISIPIAEMAEMAYADIVQKIENTKITIESRTKVAINSKSGIVVIGENVRLPLLQTIGGISIRVSGGD